MIGGYQDQILDIDLSSDKISTRKLADEKTLRTYVGGAALGFRMMLKEAPHSAGPADPNTPILFVTGPLTGTQAPQSSAWMIVTVHAIAPYLPTISHTHGHWGAYLKHAGYDIVKVVGRADSLIYILIDDDKVEIRDASKLAGVGTHDTERLVKEDVGGDPEKISVASIGPAGENLFHDSRVQNDGSHGAGKGGPGFIMGSKRLKAIATRGTRPPAVADAEGLLRHAAEWEKLIETSPTANANLARNGGFLKGMSSIGDAEFIPAFNYTTSDWGKGFARRFEADAKKWVITTKASYNCKTSCHCDIEITTGPYAGFRASLGDPCGGESTNAAAVIGIEDPGAAVLFGHYADDLGIEVAGASTLLGMVYELYNRGLLTKEQTGGLDLSWGNDESARILMEQIVRREGFGAILAKGVTEAARELGPEAEKVVTHMKGVAIPTHDMRRWWGPFLGLVVSGVGPSWQGFSVDEWLPWPDIELGYPKTMDPLTWEGKARAVKLTGMKKNFIDCVGVCAFTVWGVPGSGEMAKKALSLATGWGDFSWEEALTVGERSLNLQRLIAIKRGFKKESELEVSPRLLEPPRDGKARGKTVAPYLGQMVDEYYAEMGWDINTGAPFPETLRRLGLHEFL